MNVPEWQPIETAPKASELKAQLYVETGNERSGIDSTAGQAT